MFCVSEFLLKDLPVWLQITLNTIQMLIYAFLVWKDIKKK